MDKTMGAKIAFVAGWVFVAVVAFQSLWYVNTDDPNIATVLVLAVYFLSMFKATQRFSEAVKMFPAAWKAVRGH